MREITYVLRTYVGPAQGLSPRADTPFLHFSSAMASRLDVREVVNALDELSLSVSQTRDLAFHLGVDLPQLDDIDEQHVNHRKQYYIQAWINTDPSASWQKMIDVLRQKSLNRQAEMLRERCAALKSGNETDGPHRGRSYIS